MKERNDDVKNDVGRLDGCMVSAEPMFGLPMCFVYAASPGSLPLTMSDS